MGEITNTAHIEELAAKHDLTDELVENLAYCYTRKDLVPDWIAIDIICGGIRYEVNKALYSKLKESSGYSNPNEELGILGGMNY